MEAPRMEKEDLRSRLDDPGIMIIDVRRKKEKEKIKNAVLEDPEKTDSWMNEYPKDKTLLLYCS